MKSYLARLVARAQSPASPGMGIPRPVPAAAAENPLASAPLAPSFVSPRVRSPDEPPPGIHAAALTPAPRFPAPTPTPLRGSPRSWPTPDSAPASTGAIVPEVGRPASSPRRRPPVPPIAPAKVMLQPHREPVPAPPPATFREILTARPALDETTEKRTTENPFPPSAAPVPALSPVPSAAAEEARLLQLADHFMARLSPRVGSVDASVSSPDDPAPTAPVASQARAVPLIPTATPLHPAAPVAPLPPPSAPSVVIGRLSVEIVAPAPPARRAPPGARAAPHRASARSVPAPRSSARFGFGQL